MSKVRPAHCAVCQKQLFYDGEPEHEPELTVEVKLPKWQRAVAVKNLHSVFGVETFYVHLKCWNELPITLHKS